MAKIQVANRTSIVDGTRVVVSADTHMIISVVVQTPTIITIAKTFSCLGTIPPHNITAGWVKILSSTPLMKAQNSLLARIPNFAIVPIRTETSHLLRRDCPLDPISPRKRQGLRKLREDQPKVILTVNKGVTMVVLDKQDYINKAQTYCHKRTPTDPS